jgi:hypothetical protein
MNTRYFLCVCFLTCSLIAAPGSAQAPIFEDDFTNTAGPLVPNVPWRFNETAGLTAPAYDGTTSLLMDMNGAWDQYIDHGYAGGAAGLMSKDVALVAIFTAPADAGIALGYTSQDGGWSDDNNRVIKLDNGDILISDDHISAASNVDTGQDYVAGTPQGVMWLLDTSGNLTVHYQNGSDPSPTAAGWVDITPAAPGILTMVYGPTANNKWGVNAYGNASAQFQLDYIGLFDLGATPLPDPSPEGDFTCVFEDQFDAAAGADVDLMNWFKSGTRDTLHNGSGHLTMDSNSPGGAHNDPAINTSGIFSFPGTEYMRLEVSFLAGGMLNYFGFQPDDPVMPQNVGAPANTNGRCIRTDPNGANPDASIGLSLHENSVTGTPGAISTGFLIPPGPQQMEFQTVRITFDPSTTPGTAIYEVFAGGNWVVINPLIDTYNTYDKSMTYVVYIEAQGFTGGGDGPDLDLDYVTVKDLNQPIGIVNQASSWTGYD